MPTNMNTLVITTFEEYIAINNTSQKVTLEQANKYAQNGRQFLEAVMTGNEEQYPSKNKSDNVAFLHWYLIKESFNQNKPFSKGTFNLEGENNEATLKLYNYLKGDNKKKASNSSLAIAGLFLKGINENALKNQNQTYSRGSTHYTKHLANSDGSFGIDKVNIPLAWRFKTHVFGLTKNTDGTLSVYLKPETASADLNKTKASIKHGVNLIKSIVKKGGISGLSESFREDAIANHLSQFVIDSLRAENILNKTIENKIAKCRSIPQLKEIITNSNSKLDLNDYLISHYGSTNQIGSEQRLKITNDGRLIRPMETYSKTMGNNPSNRKENKGVSSSNESATISRYKQLKLSIKNLSMHNIKEETIKQTEDTENPILSHKAGRI